MQQPIQLNPTDKIPVTLEAQQWNMVLAIIAEAPFKVAAPLIEIIRGQCMSHEVATIDAMQPPAEAKPDA